MTHFAVGDQVTIRYGLQQGLKATVLKSRPLDAYLVKVEDGTVRFYSGKGLETVNEGVQRIQRIATSAAASLARRISSFNRAR